MKFMTAETLHPVDVSGDEFEEEWCRRLGPTATLLMRFAVRHDGQDIESKTVARMLGVADHTLRRACARIDTFRVGLWRDDPELLVVKRRVTANRRSA